MTAEGNGGGLKSANRMFANVKRIPLLRTVKCISMTIIG